MEAALEIHDYLPQAYPSANEGEYIRFLWEAFESNYQSGKYQFSILAFHMLYMSYVYFSVWQIKQAKPEAFTHAVLFQLKLLVRALERSSDEFGSPPDPTLALLAERIALTAERMGLTPEHSDGRLRRIQHHG